MERSSFDVVIVGGGTAGCVLAARLSARPDLSVLLLEAGANRNLDGKVTTPLPSRRMFGDPEYDWCLTSTPQLELNGRTIQHTRGRMIGGSSAINSHSLVYPNKAMHDAWAEIAGDQRRSWEQMKDCYQGFKTEQTREPSGGVGQTGGPIHASYPAKLHPLQKAWEDVFTELGAKSTKDGLSGEAMGGVTTSNAIDGRPEKGVRSFSGNGYLEPAMGRENLVVECGAVVRRVVLEKSEVGRADGLRAVGVCYEKLGVQTTVEAKRNLSWKLVAYRVWSTYLASAVSYHTGITFQHAYTNRGIPENLQDHLNFGPSVEVNPDIETMDVAARDPAVAAAQLAEYERHKTGPLSEGAAYSFAYWPLQLFNTPAEEADLQALLEQSASTGAKSTQMQRDFICRMISDQGEASATVFMTRRQRYTVPGNDAPGNYMTVVAMLAHPFSRGSTHIKSRDCHDQPAIDCAYSSHHLDVEILARHVAQIERLLEHPVLASVRRTSSNRLPADAGFRTLNDIKDAIKRYGATNYHPCGTCSMREDGLGGVVDADLRVKGTSNLRVCDASIFPIIPRGNILTTVYAVAEKASEFILASYG
ncbi:putative choline dehydrogenase [Colletotrichum sublineola]|uniref:Putative choline dehydrogenase n=1 Tax=Colletotrichum sublineola TaxID=1173701 RepID=A0A066XZS2_COLSU|nr:putative choline dehydrogenase [Colletotrichum sublineola]